MSMTVEEWMARGNKVKELKIGETAYKDGILPPKRPDPKTMETPKHVIDKRNKEIRKTEMIEEKREKLEAEQMDKLKAKIKRENRIQDQFNLLEPFYEKAQKVDVSKLIKITGIYSGKLLKAKHSTALSDSEFNLLKSSIENFVFNESLPKPKRIRKNLEPRGGNTENKLRLKVVKKAKEDALKNGGGDFLAPCKKHGLTTYFFQPSGFVKCRKCKQESCKRYHDNVTQTPEQKIKHERLSKNNALLKEAVANGEKRFTANCLKHGETEFLVFKRSEKRFRNCYGYQSKCRECGIELSKKYRDQVRDHREKCLNEYKANA